MTTFMNHTNDPDRDAYLNFIARCEQTFTPFAPLELPDFFVGRHREVARLISELNAPGRQVAIYGDRGVGKTSLAYLCSFFANRSEEHTHFVRCTQAHTYEEILAEILRRASVTHVPSERQTARTRRSGVGVKGLAAGRSAESRATERVINGAYKIGPGLLLDAFADIDGLLIIDEFDRVRDPETHVKIAETLKAFSDARSRTKILIVGVADSLSSLLARHASLTRCVAEIRLDRMATEELEELLSKGEQRLDVKFDLQVKRRIIGLSDGYAHYAHLLARYATFSASTRGWSAGREVAIGREAYNMGLRDAIDNAELRLRESYQKAIIPLKRKTQLFQYAVWAVSMADVTEVHVSEIAQHMSVLSGEIVKPRSCQYHLGKLVSEDRDNILMRVREGFYKFTDPLMRAYARLQLEAYNIIECEGQMEFSFMESGKAATIQGWAPPLDPRGRPVE